ncbi:uncharacterized protein LOC108478067 [Gossypium arboreum]|uniref:uncharacterized protein LOC108478067 n=1 Tax=Gossypium arboreum TaxID=29729 RepID=UPI0022F16420|nr:uncharacterized protein LOC108478067 [Gossypium arboreum]
MPQQYQANASTPINIPIGSGANPGDNPANPFVPDLDDMAEMEKGKIDMAKQLDNRCKWLEEKFKAMEATDYCGRIDAKDLSLVLDLDSLTGSAAKWYNQLSRAQIGSWKDLAQAFIKQYGHVTDIAPDRITLQNMEKKPSETFKQYAQRWREIAMQVQPPLLEKETTMLFINTLKTPFINHMLGSATKSFSDIVMSGEMIENAVRCGKIEAGESAKRSAPRRKESEVNNASIYNKSYSKPVIVSQPRAVTTSHQGLTKQDSNPRPNTERVQFTPIPMTYKELYKNLFDAHVVSPFYLKPMQPPFPKWYDANAQCEYHAGISGHTIENCTAFKKLVERFIKMGIVKFDDPTGPNVAGNPLPSHSDEGVNAIVENEGRRTKIDVSEVKTPLKWVWKKMVEEGLLTQGLGEKPEGAKYYCEYHNKEGHEIQECNEFRAMVQILMENKEIEFFEYTEGLEGEDVCTSEQGPTNNVRGVNHPVVIISRPRVNEVGVLIAPKVIIQKPVAFPYKDSKRVPWNYDCNVTIPGGENPVVALGKGQDEGFYTRSGRRYTPNTKAESAKGKSVVIEQEKEKTTRPGSPVNEPVTEKEAKEFLKFLKHSEYSIVEQLHKQPARISVLALLLSSDTHRSALMKVLNETYVADDISVNKLDRLVNNISADNFIFFNDDEIPSGDMGSTKALHITTRCKGYTLPGVLIDNGSALNVMPLSALNRLPVDNSHMKTCQNVVRAFDGTERKVMGRIEIPFLIGPNTYEVDFLVMDIKPSYNCLLGRPWIHSAEAVPSSLHQKLKLVTEGRLVTINAKEDIIASLTSDTPYVGTDDEAIECSFRSLEFVNATFIVEGNKIPAPKISETTRMGLRLTIGKGALPGKGLGRCLQGRIEVPVLKEKRDRFGLGFKPDAKQKKKELEKRQEMRRARLCGEEVKWEPMTFPHLSKTFISGGTIYSKGRSTRKEPAEEVLESLSINAISEGKSRKFSRIRLTSTEAF